MFSGSTRAYRCQDCGETFSDTTPTSVIPFALATFGAFVLWAGFWDNFIAAKLAVMGLSGLLAVGSLLASLWLITAVGSARFRGNHCPKCGGSLNVEGAGFVDSGTPTRSELVIHGIVLGVPVALNLFTWAT